MKRWWIVVALLLSIGFNLGLMAVLLVQNRAARLFLLPTPPVDAIIADTLPAPVLRLTEAMRLDPTTRQAFLDIQQTFFDQTIAARRQLGAAQASLRRELIAESPRRQRIDHLLAQVDAAHSTLERAFVDNLLASRQLLDGKQEKMFLRFLARLRQRRPHLDRSRREPWLSSPLRRSSERQGERPLPPPPPPPPP